MTLDDQLDLPAARRRAARNLHLLRVYRAAGWPLPPVRWFPPRQRVSLEGLGVLAVLLGLALWGLLR